jgi:hypothetical protein
MYCGNFTDIKRISQQFLDYGLHNDKSTKNSPCENFGLHRVCVIRSELLHTSYSNPKIKLI